MSINIFYWSHFYKAIRNYVLLSISLYDFNLTKNLAQTQIPPKMLRVRAQIRWDSSLMQIQSTRQSFHDFLKKVKKKNAKKLETFLFQAWKRRKHGSNVLVHRVFLCISRSKILFRAFFVRFLTQKSNKFWNSQTLFSFSVKCSYI